MKYYEIKNKLTQETAQITAPNFSKACQAKGWKPYQCQCIWKASVENACDPTLY